MARTTIQLGVLLTLIGLFGYFGTGTSSITALIPSFIGIPVIGLGWWAQNPDKRKMAIHIALVLALVAALGSFGGVTGLISSLTGGISPTTAQWLRSLTFLACLIYLVMGVRSFIAARR